MELDRKSDPIPITLSLSLEIKKIKEFTVLGVLRSAYASPLGSLTNVFVSRRRALSIISENEIGGPPEIKAIKYSFKTFK